jgi:4-alpha-glucanotransferase
MPGPFPHRTYGVLLHPSSLPGRDRIGTLGRGAHEFVGWLAEAGVGLWQILPLTINGRADSPYFSSSAFAGNLWLIDLEHLQEHGLLDAQSVWDALHAHDLDGRVHFDELYARKRPLLWSAAERLLADREHAWQALFRQFVDESGWLADASLFFAVSDSLRAPWWEWPDPLRRRDPGAMAEARRDLQIEIERWQAVLFLFEIQWRELRATAHQFGIRVLGDLPIYVAPDSADVWANQTQFQLDADGRLAVQSGVPPDYFSATGQLWGNPLYDWEAMAADGYRWWLDRLARCLDLTDVVRIDHFRALAAYWEVPGDADTAIDGRWVAGPGQAFLDAVRAAFPEFPFVAEDLGTLDDDVYELRDRNQLPGMRVIQFGFDGMPDNAHLAHRYPEACVVYTGTHDNQPIAGWWASLDAAKRDEVGHYYQHGPDASQARATWSLIEAALGSRAVAAVIPVQDLLVLDDRGRINDPSHEHGNWGWRMPHDATSTELAHTVRSLAARYGRVTDAR